MYQGERRRAHQAGWWLAAQAFALAVVTAWLLIEMAAGHAGDIGRGLGVAAVALCGVVAAGALAWALSIGKRLARTPALLWHGLLVLVGISMSSSGAPTLGVVLIAVGAVGFVLALRVPAAGPD